MHKSSGAFHLTDDRIKGAVGVLRRAEIAQARVRFAGEAFHERRSKPRLADTCLAGKQHHLTFAALCLRPAPQQQFEFFFPPDQLGQIRSRAVPRSGFRPKLARNAAQARTGPTMPLRSFAPRSSKLEQIAKELSGALQR